MVGIQTPLPEYESAFEKPTKSPKSLQAQLIIITFDSILNWKCTYYNNLRGVSLNNDM